MLEVSSDFQKEVYNQTIGRKTSAKVRFEIVDDEAYEDVKIQTSPPSTLSPLYDKQLVDRVRNFKNKYATFEREYFKLDGSFKIPPTPEEIIKNDIQMGYRSEELSKGTLKTWGNIRQTTWGENLNDKWGNTLLKYGYFEIPLILEFTFSEKHNSAGFSIYFDELNNEYAIDFDIIVYNDSEVLTEINVKDNHNTKYSYVGKFKNYNKIIVKITKWSAPIRRCKIAEVDFGAVKEYTDEDLINVRVVQELSPTTKTIPSDEVRFTIDNSLKKFNPLNPKGFYEFLKKGQHIFVEMGVEIRPNEFEYVPVGKYYLQEWVSDEGTLTSTFIGRDIFETLNNREVQANENVRDISLYDFAEELLLDNNITDYEITNNLKDIKTTGIHGAMTYRKLLEHIAVAGKCVIFQDNYGKVHIKETATVTEVPFNIYYISEQPSLGSTDQLTNGKISPDYNFASFERNRFKLNGSFQLPSKNMSDIEVGWWSEQISKDTAPKTWGEALGYTWGDLLIYPWEMLGGK